MNLFDYIVSDRVNYSTRYESKDQRWGPTEFGVAAAIRARIDTEASASEASKKVEGD